MLHIRRQLSILTVIAVGAVLVGTAHSAVILDLTSNNADPFTLAGGDNTFSFSSFSVDYLIVAGGGGGGGRYFSRSGGGGGAGGLLTGTTNIAGLQTITVGAGGAGATGINSNNATNGGNSSISGIATATGGGRGGHNTTGAASGGSGGGGSGTTAGAAGTALQGNAGGSATDGNNGTSSGGGGAGGVGQSDTAGGAGGAGVASSITGASVTYAAGGDGGLIVAGIGAGAPGAANTGNGGDGGRSDDVSSNSGKGGAGGSGIVVVRYAGPQVLAGGTVSTDGGDTVHQFLSTGASTLDLFSATIDGDIDGAGNLVWDKTGTLTLGGTNTYTGSTKVNAGILALLGSIGSTSDLIFGGGTLDLGSTGSIKVLQSNYSITDANNDITNSLILGDVPLQVSTFNDGSNDFTLITLIPEPASLALGLVGLALIAGRPRRK